MGWHGHDQPALRYLQQPGARRAAGTAKRGISRSRIFSVLCQQRLADFRPGLSAMRYFTQVLLGNSLASVLWTGDAAFAASSETDFKNAYATANAAEQEAGRLRNQWLATEAAL